jgi:hypothetical protein
MPPASVFGTDVDPPVALVAYGRWHGDQTGRPTMRGMKTGAATVAAVLLAGGAYVVGVGQGGTPTLEVAPVQAELEVADEPAEAEAYEPWLLNAADAAEAPDAGPVVGEDLVVDEPTVESVDVASEEPVEPAPTAGTDPAPSEPADPPAEDPQPEPDEDDVPKPETAPEPERQKTFTDDEGRVGVEPEPEPVDPREAEMAGDTDY